MTIWEGYKKEMDKNLIRIISLILLIAVATMPLPTSAQPVPHGISGMVYLSDGMTQAPRGTPFSVHDITSGYYIEGVTGGPPMPQFNGYYSVSIMGKDGDVVVIKAWNATHSGITTVTLAGDMTEIEVIINKAPEVLPSLTPTPAYPKGGGAATTPTVPSTATPLGSLPPITTTTPEATPVLPRTPTSSITPSHTPTIMPKPGWKIPGFEVLSALSVLFVVVYILKRQERGK